MFTEWMARGKPTVLGAASGAVAGLVAITPASGFVGPMASHRHRRRRRRRSATSACNLKSKLGYDDSLDVVGVHGVGGTWGALATGLFAIEADQRRRAATVSSTATPGSCGPRSWRWLATYALAIVGTFVILKIVDALVGLRVTDEDEMAGLDLSQHSETAYAFGGGAYGEYRRVGAAPSPRLRPATSAKPRRRTDGPLDLTRDISLT